MRILRNISLFLCVVTFACEAHAMLRGCVGVVDRYVIRRAPSVLGAAANAQNAGSLLRGQQPPLLNQVFGQPPVVHPIFVQQYATTAGGPAGTNSEDDEQENTILDEVRQALRERSRIQGTVAFYEHLEAAVSDNEDESSEDEQTLILEQAREEVEGALGGNWSSDGVAACIERIRTRILIGDGRSHTTLLSVLGTVNSQELLDTFSFDAPEGFIVRAILRRLGNPEPHENIGYSRIEEALYEFCEDPVAFVASF